MIIIDKPFPAPRQPLPPRVAALGTFDGVHLGHQELIRRGREMAEKTGAQLQVCTFDRHPLEVICPQKAPGLLMTAAERRERMADCGAEELRVIPFTRETADLEPEDFLDLLGRECSLRAVVAGWNYSFGRAGRGDAALLRAEGRKRGFEVLIVPPVRTEAGEIISSSAIRRKLTEGDLDGANAMLGFPYPISGTVIGGKHEGSRIGFPTANIGTEPGKQLPAYGVYAGILECGERKWKAVANIGLQPTLPSGGVTVEAHIPGASPDLYGKHAVLRLHRFLRAERRFASVEELAVQIAKDQRDALDFFQRNLSDDLN